MRTSSDEEVDEVYEEITGKAAKVPREFTSDTNPSLQKRPKLNDNEAAAAGAEPTPVIARWDLPPPLTLRWQELPPEDPNSLMIIVAEEDNPAINGEVEVDLEVKEEEKGFANYIRMGDVSLPCKICPNLDRHMTFNCSNLTPALKERLKNLRSKYGDMKASDPDTNCCHICDKRDHWTHACPYILKYPGNAHIRDNVKIICLCCGEFSPHPGKPGVDWEARCLRPF